MDVSANDLKRIRTEQINEFKKKKHEETIKLIIRQTAYSKEKAEKKLKDWEGNYINVIKEFMNPAFKEVKNKKIVKTTNQGIMSEIRNFMDDVNKQYNYRKEVKEYHENKKKQLINHYMQRVEHQIKQAKERWPEAPESCWENHDLKRLLLQNKWDTTNGLVNKTFCDYEFK